MKVIHVPYCFYPDVVGGTEVYVETMSRELQKHGIEVVISAPTEGESKNYIHNDLNVRRFSISKGINDLSELYGEGDEKSATQFAKILDEEKPDLVHLHAFTRAVSLRLAHEAKKRKIRIIFTYHTPTVSCQRGTLMRWGKKVCDGRLKTLLCTQCTLHGLGLPRGVSDLLGLMPTRVNDILKKIRLSGKPWTAMRMHGLVSIHHRMFHEFMSETDCITVLCNWARDLLLKNGVPEEKIALIRHGLHNLNKDVSAEAERGSNSAKADGLQGPLRIVYIGRLHPTKGIDVLIKAVKSLSHEPVALDIYGTVQPKTEEEYLQKLKKLTRGDSRIVFKESVSNDNVMKLLKDYHILAVPSRWLETGPLVVLDAFAAGIPVLGSNLGGIAELIENETNGILIKVDDIKAWSKALERCCNNREFLKQLKLKVTKPNTMDYVAKKTKELYELFRKSSN